MRRVRVLVVVLLVVCGCADEPFADPQNPTVEECTAIEARWRAVVETIDRTCSTEADCIVIEGSYCDGGQTTLGGCYGTPLNGVAYQAARARLADAASGWGSCTCDLVGCAVDCQAGSARCDDGACSVVDDNVCNPPGR